MPDPKKRIEKKKAQAKRKGAKLLKASERVNKKATKKYGKANSQSDYSKRRKTEIKGMAKGQTAKKLAEAGQNALKTGQRPPSKSSLTTTPKSAHKKVREKDKRYAGSKSWRKR